jgi:hypothetical protein
MANLLIKPATAFIVVAIYIIVRLDVYQIKALYTVACLCAFILFTGFFCIQALLLCLRAYFGDLSNVSISKYNSKLGLCPAYGAGDPALGLNNPAAPCYTRYSALYCRVSSQASLGQQFYKLWRSRNYD